VSRDPDTRFLQHFAPSLEVMDAAEFASDRGLEIIATASAVVYFTWCSVPATFASEAWREIPENVEPAFEFFQRVANVSKEAKIVFLSSGGTVYGGEGTDPKSEASPTNPISPYGLGKLMAEDALSFVGRTTGVPYAILRVSNAIGQWQVSETQGIANVALRAARDGVPFRLFGSGLQVRDFVDADDVAEAIMAASADTMHRSATWNVGSGIGITVADLMRLLSDVTGRPVPFEHAPARSLDVPHVVLDCRKARTELGWSAKTPIEQSISGLWEAVQRG
jgi:UDP-glucose 4-epimerase